LLCKKFTSFKIGRKIVRNVFSKVGATIVLALLAASGADAADVGVSIQFGQPGFYGRIDLGDFQQPQVIYREPRIVQRVTVSREPLYLVVPPGHMKHWDKHCRKYDACGRQVYFVQEQWYNDVVVQRYRESRDRQDYQGDDDRGHGKEKNHGKGKGHGKDKD
jgi:hypothetical protein